MRFGVVALLCCLVAGCKSKPVESPPAAVADPLVPQILQPLHPEVLRPRVIPIAADPGGIALHDYGQRRGEPQIRPEPPAIVAPNAKPDSAESLFQQGQSFRDADPLKAAGLYRAAMDASKAQSPTWTQARNQLMAIGPAIRKGVEALYLRAYQLKDSDPEKARALFREVQGLTSENQELYELYEKSEAQLLHLKH